MPDAIARSLGQKLDALEFQMQTATDDQLREWAATDTIAALFAAKHLQMRQQAEA